MRYTIGFLIGLALAFLAVRLLLEQGLPVPPQEVAQTDSARTA